MLETIKAWVITHPIETATIAWGMFSIALFLDLTLKMDRESPLVSYRKLEYIEEQTELH